jgi:alpha-D-xyloside xylohydrolase
MRLLVVSGLALLAACGDDDALVPAVPLVSGPATLTLSDDGSSLVFGRGDTTLLTFHADGFQAGTVDSLDTGDSFDPYWLAVDSPPEPPAGLTWRALGAAERMRVVASSDSELVLELRYRGATGTVRFAPTMTGCFSARLTATVDGAQAVAFLRLRPDADPTEGFYGLGEWADGVEHRGKLRPMQIEVDLTSEGGTDENHVPVPLLIGTRGWGLFVRSDRPGAFDVARETPTRVDVTFGTGVDSAGGLEAHLLSADRPLDVLARYHDLTGYPGLPAPWAYGPLLWRNENADQAQVLDDITQIRSRKLAVSGIWFDRPYATGVETFDFDPVKFPTAPAMLQALHDAGLRYGIWHAPYTAPAGGQDAAGTQFEYASSNGFFPPMTGVQVNPWSKPIDFTNPAAYAWWQSNLRRYTDALGAGGLGVEGFKLDYGEDVVVGILGRRTPWRFADGSDEGTMHRGYTLLYHQIYREVLAPEGAFLLTRTGRWGDQVQGMIVWPGDLDASFAHHGDPRPGQSTVEVGGLPTALAFGIGLSASGFPFYASDTGGYRHSPPDREVWIRWVEASAIGSSMQIGDASSQQPWEFNPQNGRDQAALGIYQRYTSLHLRLFPYAWSYALRLAATGHPLVRPFGLVYPQVGAHPSDQFLFGDHLLAAPVIAAGATTRAVQLPPGEWVDWWGGAIHDGGTSGAVVTVPAALDTLPLFVARGGIVPMLRDTVETLAPVASGSGIDSFAADAGILTVRVAPASTPTSFTVHDGAEVTQVDTAGVLGLGFTPATGADAVYAQGVLFEVITVAASPTTVINGATPLPARASKSELDAAADGWFWEAATGGTLWIKVPGAATITVP